MLETGLSAYFASATALRSADPVVRRPAISTLLDLARRSEGPVQASAARTLAREFGPYAVSEGLSGCAGSVEAVVACCAEDRDCRNCAWLWRDPSATFDAPRDLFGPEVSEAIG